MTTSALSEAMGIERSSFYNSFGDRATLFREALSRYSEITPDKPLAHLRPGQPVTPIITSVFRNICRVRAADPDSRGCLMVNSIITLVGTDSELATVITEAVRRQVVIFERLIRQAAAQGEIPLPKDLPGAASALTSFLMGLNVFARIERSEAALWAACRHELGNLGFRVRS